MARDGGLFSELIKEFGNAKTKEEEEKLLSEDHRIEEGLRKRKHLLSQTSNVSAQSQDEHHEEESEDPNQVSLT